MKAYLIDFENVKSKGLTGIESLGETDKVIIFYSENSDTISFEMHRKVMSSSADIQYLKVRVGGKNALDFQLSTMLGFMVAKDIYSHIFIISNDKGFDKLHDFWNSCYDESRVCTVFRTQTIGAAVNYANSNPTTDKCYEEPKEEQAEEQAAAPVMDEVKEQHDEKAETQPEPESVTLPIEILNEEHELTWGMPVSESYSDQVENAEIKKIPAKKRGRRPKSVTGQIRSSLLGLFDCSDEDIETIRQCLWESESKEDFHNSLAKVFKNNAGELYKVLRPKYLRLKELMAQENQQAVSAEEAEPAQQTEISVQNDVSPLFAEVSRLLSGKFTEDEIKTVAEIAKRTDTKQRLYLSIVKEYKKDKGCEIYKYLKPEYALLEKLRSAENV